MRIGIIGAGLGGLLAGASLIKLGHDVTIFEKLSYFGGRFTNFDKKGFGLSTGALHMIPHAEKGPLGTMLKELDTGVEIVYCKPEGYYRIDGKDYLQSELPGLFSIKDKAKILAIVASLKFGAAPDDATFREWLQKRIDNELVMQITDSFCGWGLSINADEISAREMIAITTNVNKLRGPGVPVGGCMGVTSALVRKIEEGGGKIHYKTPITKIKIEHGKATGLKTNEGNFDFDIVVSDIGPKETIKLAGPENFDQSLVSGIDKINESCGIKMSIACKKPMLGHPGILFTPQAKRIDGINEVTNADPFLAPEGMHLMMTHQRLNMGMGAKEEIELGLTDLRELFPDFDEHCEVLLVQTFKKGWPVNRSRSGESVSHQSGVDGLYFVGDGVKPSGWIETEGVAAGVKLVIDEIEK
ncbi:NAD(P)/FAD-dependent oxidoreductase [archaeon]|nr:NAD(P)/FAD-dependent oxidoreductase [archaeon]